MANSTYTFLTICTDIGEAQVLKSFLNSKGFSPRVRDEQTRTIAPHFGQALGKIIIEIPESEFVEASAVLEQVDDQRNAEQATAHSKSDQQSEALTYTQGLAKKALFNSILGVTVVPFLCSLYSIIIGYRVLKMERPLSKVSQRRLALALVFNMIAIYVVLSFNFFRIF